MSVINREKKFIWIWVPKNAGSSIYNKLKECNVNGGCEGDHASFMDINRSHKTDSYFKWAFVRNPYTRIASAYYHLVNAHSFRVYESFDEFIF